MSLQFHLKSCKEKFNREQEQLPKNLRKNADKILADVPYYQDCDIMIGLRDDEAPFVKVVQRYVPEEIVLWYKENN